MGKPNYHITNVQVNFATRYMATYQGICFLCIKSCSYNYQVRSKLLEIIDNWIYFPQNFFFKWIQLSAIECFSTKTSKFLSYRWQYQLIFTTIQYSLLVKTANWRSEIHFIHRTPQSSSTCIESKLLFWHKPTNINVVYA